MDSQYGKSIWNVNMEIQLETFRIIVVIAIVITIVKQQKSSFVIVNPLFVCLTKGSFTMVKPNVTLMRSILYN